MEVIVFMFNVYFHFLYVGVLVNDVLIQVRMGPFVSCLSATTWTVSIHEPNSSMYGVRRRNFLLSQTVC